MKNFSTSSVVILSALSAITLSSCASHDNGIENDHGATSQSPSYESNPQLTENKSDSGVSAPKKPEENQNRPNPTTGSKSDTAEKPSMASGGNQQSQQSNGGAVGGSPQQTAPAEQVGGTCGTILGDPVIAGPTTSCGFAMEIATKGTAGTHPVAYWPVTAVSPATGKTYTLSCAVAGPADRVWCKDLEGDAEVTVGPGSHRSWSHLVG